MDPTLYDEVRAMRESLNTYHTEVVQRLTALEVTLSPLPKIEERVKRLEVWRSFLAGGWASIVFAGGVVLTWITRRH